MRCCRQTERLEPPLRDGSQMRFPGDAAHAGSRPRSARMVVARPRGARGASKRRDAREASGRRCGPNHANDCAPLPRTPHRSASQGRGGGSGRRGRPVLVGEARPKSPHTWPPCRGQSWQSPGQLQPAQIWATPDHSSMRQMSADAACGSSVAPALGANAQAWSTSGKGVANLRPTCAFECSPRERGCRRSRVATPCPSGGRAGGHASSKPPRPRGGAGGPGSRQAHPARAHGRSGKRGGGKARAQARRTRGGGRTAGLSARGTSSRRRGRSKG